MKIILKYILTNIKERKLRTAVIFLSILLSSMLLFVSFSDVYKRQRWQDGRLCMRKIRKVGMKKAAYSF